MQSQIVPVFSVTDQENFMHLIYDVVHIGISVISIEIRLDHLYGKFGKSVLKTILNTPMKDSKYSDEYICPIIKCLYQTKNNQPDQEFFNNKLETLKLLKTYGADIINVGLRVLDDLFTSDIINEEILDFYLYE